MSHPTTYHTLRLWVKSQSENMWKKVSRPVYVQSIIVRVMLQSASQFHVALFYDLRHSQYEEVYRKYSLNNWSVAFWWSLPKYCVKTTSLVQTCYIIKWTIVRQNLFSSYVKTFFFLYKSLITLHLAGRHFWQVKTLDKHHFHAFRTKKGTKTATPLWRKLQTALGATAGCMTACLPSVGQWDKRIDCSEAAAPRPTGSMVAIHRNKWHLLIRNTRYRALRKLVFTTGD
jgi:hypothetical protein